MGSFDPFWTCMFVLLSILRTSCRGWSVLSASPADRAGVERGVERLQGLRTVQADIAL